MFKIGNQYYPGTEVSYSNIMGEIPSITFTIPMIINWDNLVMETVEIQMKQFNFTFKGIINSVIPNFDEQVLEIQALSEVGVKLLDIVNELFPIERLKRYEYFFDGSYVFFKTGEKPLIYAFEDPTMEPTLDTELDNFITLSYSQSGNLITIQNLIENQLVRVTLNKEHLTIFDDLEYARQIAYDYQYDGTYTYFNVSLNKGDKVKFIVLSGFGKQSTTITMNNVTEYQIENNKVTVESDTDQTVTVKVQGNYDYILPIEFNANYVVSRLCKQLNVNYDVDSDVMIDEWKTTDTVINELNRLCETFNIDFYIDNDTVIMKDRNYNNPIQLGDNELCAVDVTIDLSEYYNKLILTEPTIIKETNHNFKIAKRIENYQEFTDMGKINKQVRFDTFNYINIGDTIETSLGVFKVVGTEITFNPYNVKLQLERKQERLEDYLKTDTSDTLVRKHITVNVNAPNVKYAQINNRYYSLKKTIIDEDNTVYWFNIDQDIFTVFDSIIFYDYTYNTHTVDLDDCIIKSDYILTVTVNINIE